VFEGKRVGVVVPAYDEEELIGATLGGIPPLVDLVKAFKPSVVYLGHHDGPGVTYWAANYPAAYAIRDASPTTRTMEVLYRTPVCFNTASKEMVIGW